MQDAIDLVQKFGFPIVMAVGMGYYIYYIWKYVTEQITPKLDESHINLIKVIDQIRMLDNDLIRLQQKDIQVQKSELQRNKSIKPLLDNRKSGNEPKEGDSRKTRS